MSTHIHLKHPPLREAAIHLQLAEELPLSAADSLRRIQLVGFDKVTPIKKSRFSFQLNIESPAQASVTSDESDGYRHEFGDAARVVQFRRSAMTYSVLRGYSAWEEIKTSTITAWNEYIRVLEPVTVAQVAVRYINVIQVPIGVDYDAILTAGPRIPEKLPQLLNSFFHRVVIPFSEAEATAVITQLPEPATERNVPLVLDIEINAPCKAEGHSTVIWSRLEQLRDIKNLVFFSSLTEKALESYR